MQNVTGDILVITLSAISTVAATSAAAYIRKLRLETPARIRKLSRKMSRHQLETGNAIHALDRRVDGLTERMARVEGIVSGAALPSVAAPVAREPGTE